MKTPREILLEKHQAVQPKLDQLRHETLECGLQAASSPALAESFSPCQSVPAFARGSGLKPALPKQRFTFFLSQLWRELIRPSRRAWGGLAAAWVVIIFVNLSDSEPNIHIATMHVSQTAPVMIEIIQERQRLIAEFMAENTFEEPADRPHPVLHPRSERRLNYKLA